MGRQDSKSLYLREQSDPLVILDCHEASRMIREVVVAMRRGEGTVDDVTDTIPPDAEQGRRGRAFRDVDL